jgi:L,D-peptidoglycan transpeptidase YkuD (ErfK/YbiS/YcfS/YnhG family)
MRKRRKKDHTRSVRRITLISSARERHRGLLRCGPLLLPCAIGRSGISHLKREGDGATPAGSHRLLSLNVRRDRQLVPRTQVPLRTLRRNDGWCEDKRHGRYNCPIRLPSAAGHETMWRKDHLYDLVGVLDWNMRPRIRGRGSAIFLHLARPDYSPTAGCIALNIGHLRRLLAAAGSQPEFVVASRPRKQAAENSKLCPSIVGHRKAR